MHRETRERALTVWLTGLPSSGKTTLGRVVVQHLLEEGDPVEMLDGDLIRSKIARDLGFSRQDREESLRRICFVADMLARNGITVVVAAISPYRTMRRELRSELDPFLEVFVNAPLAVCEKRDVKGLYRRCRKGEIHGMTGIDDVYEPPLSPEVECHTDVESIEESVSRIMTAVRMRREGALLESKSAWNQAVGND